MAIGSNSGAFASLSSGLLARKGAAKPAMRPQGFGQMGASLEDLGWNDMGFEAPKPTVGAERDATHDAFGDAIADQPLRNPVAALTPSPVHGQQAELAARLAEANDEGEEETAEEADNVPSVAQAPVLRASLPESAEQEAAEESTVSEVRPPVISLKARTPDAPAAAARRAPAARAVRGTGLKAAFTLRLDSGRHLRLRLACALTGRSAQMLVTDAVDKLLAEYPELDSFAGSLPEGGVSRRVKG